MKRLIALFAALVVSTVGAQTVQNTPNLITSGTTHTWTGVTTGAMPPCCSGGPTPLYDPATNMVSFSYNANATVAQSIAINNALANVGAGVKINGYDYKYDIRNMNGDNRQGGTDTLNVYQALVGTNGTNLLSSQQTYNTKFDWQTVTGVQTANTPIEIANASRLTFKMVGGDNGYWAGYFGPQVRNVNMRLNYTVDPCATNPAYDPSCANYNTVQTSSNLVPNPGAYAVYGSSVDNSYAINQALSLSGANVMIHGFQWGYVANANGPYCASWLVVCWDQRTPSVTTNVSITDNNNNNLYSISRTYTNSYNTTNYQYVFPSSKNLSTLGRFNFTATTNDAAYIGDMWSKALYTPDPCTVNPLSSTSCPGYQQAYLDQQCTANPLYSQQCPGYAAAYLTQQCSANTLYSPSCPGYAAAYQIQQCSINPLYSPDCPGYAQAYHDQQCSLNPLYAQDCTGYQQAYHDQQCRISPLYMSDCIGYQQAFHDQQCSLNALYATDCPGYQQAYFSQQCTASPLYSPQCPGYAVAYKNQQCSINPLYATDCAGYAVAYHDAQCIANPLYMNDCPGYQAAYLTQQCNISQLYSTSCPGYQQAYFSQQCQLNGLYDRTCPNYASAYAAKNILSTPTTASVTPVATTTATATTSTTTSSNPAAAAISDPVVSSAVTAPSTTSATSVTSVTSVVAAPTTTSPTGVTSLSSLSTSTVTQSTSVSATSSDSVSVETKTTSSTSGPNGSNSVSTTSSARVSTGSGPQGNAPSAKDEKRSAEAKAKATVEKVKSATRMEDQVAVQGAVLNSMAFVPGFSAYQNVTVPDINQLRMARQYSKPPVDNNRTQRLLGGAQEQRWNEMVDSQYNNYNRGN